MIYNFCIGTLWIKLALVYSSTIEVLKELFRIYPQVYLTQHLELHQQISLICQISPENDMILDKIYDCVNMKKLTNDTEDMTSVLYNDCR
jgi:hypothetical protein